MAYILEETKGNLPTWLAPVQVRVMPVKTDNEELTAYAKEICDALEAKDVRVELDDRSEKLGYRMREGQVQKVHNIPSGLSATTLRKTKSRTVCLMYNI